MWTGVTATLGALVAVLSDDALPTWPRHLCGIGFAASIVGLLAAVVEAAGNSPDPARSYRHTPNEEETP